MADMLNRRAALGALAAAALFPTRPANADNLDADAEIFALSGSIIARCEEAKRFRDERIVPFEPRFHEILFGASGSQTARWEAACAYSRHVGHEAALIELGQFEEATDGLFNRMMGIRATTQAGRAAKVRALLVHVMCDGWRGPSDELDWDKEMARALLGEFAGLDASELEAI